MPAPRLLLATALALAASACASSVDVDGYLREAKDRCRLDGGLLSCAKYRTALVLHRLASSQRSMNVGPLRLVSMNASNAWETQDDTDWPNSLVPDSRSSEGGEPELARMFRFGLRQIRLFLGSHGVSVPIGENAQLVTDDGTNTIKEESRSRNLHLIVPLMIMVKLMGITGMLIPTLLGVAAIKKFIILTIMVLPTFLHKLKACKIIPHFVHYTPHHTHSHEFHDDYAAPHYDHHHKEWDHHHPQRRTGYGRGF